MIRGRIASGRWKQLHRGVYRLTGVPGSWRQSLMAACLAAGSGAVVSHRAAAALWRMAGFDERVLEVTIPRQRGRTSGFTIHRTTSMRRIDVTVLDGIPVTTPARTLIDLSSTSSADVLEEALDDALRRELCTLDRLRRGIDALGTNGRRGIGVIRVLVEARERGGVVPDSVLETRTLRLIRAGGLPEPILQHEVRVGDRVIAVIDFAWPEAMLAVEADGYRWHSGRARWQHDLVRRNALGKLGWRSVHITWWDLVERAHETVEEIGAAYSEGFARRSREDDEAGAPGR
jgi:very-short-patch-repair endonuclease